MTSGTEPAALLRLACVEASERLVDALAVCGFRALGNVPGTWRGVLQVDTGARTVVDVHVPDEFPYAQPSVRPLSRAAAETWLGTKVSDYYEATDSWHRERTGSLCLFEQTDHTLLPWADPQALLEQVQAWLRQDRAGWPGDAPALDADRYLEHTGQVVLYGELQSLIGKVIGYRRRSGVWILDRPAKVPRRSKGRPARWPSDVALVLDVGELVHPVRDWATLLDAAGEQSEHLEREVNTGIRELIVVYTRGAAHGVLALQIRTGNPMRLAAHVAAPTDVDTLMRRAHPQRTVLAERRVAVVGVGAVGSVVADLLHRSGVGHLQLVDADLVLPGNLVRHLVGADYVGKSKAAAVAAALHAARPGSTAEVTTTEEQITTLRQAFEILAERDLVIDATAESTGSSVIAAAARAGAGRAIGVAVLADGYAIRVDHWPEPLAGALAAPVLPPPRPGQYEVGCSSPVSTTPPSAAWEAAALGARHAIEVLLGQLDCPGEQRVLRTGDEAS